MFGFWLGCLEILDLVFVWMIGFFWFFWIVGFSVFQLLDCWILLENLFKKRRTCSKELDGFWFFRMAGFLVRLFFV